MIYPALFIVLGIRQGLIYGVTTLAISTLAIGFMVDISSGLFMLVAFGPLTISIIYTIKNRKKPIEVLSISTLIFLISLMAIILTIGDMEGVSIIAQLKDVFYQVMDMQLEMLDEYQLTNFELFKLRSNLESNFINFLYTVPSIIMITSLIISYLNYLISSLILRRLGYGVVFIPRFSRFKLPRNVIPGIGIMFLATIFLGSLEIFNFEAVVINLYTLGYMVFFLQGLSVIDYKLIQKKIGIIFRLFIVGTIIILSSFIGGIIAITGILDVLLDFRKFRKTV